MLQFVRKRNTIFRLNHVYRGNVIRSVITISYLSMTYPEIYISDRFIGSVLGR